MDETERELARGVADRVRCLLLALDRQDRLESAAAFVGWLPRQTAEPAAMQQISRELLLRALRVGADPANFRILQTLDPLEPIEMPQIMECSGLHRVAASERVHDLVQVGLAAREMINDQVRGTPLGRALVQLVERAAGIAGESLRDQLVRNDD